MLDNVGSGKPLGKLKNSDLRRFGAGLKFYPGVAGLFSSLRKLAAEHTQSNPHIEFYVITSGLEEIVRGSKIAKELKGIWGCQFAEAGGMIAHIKNVVSFTEKTRYLFEINKGLSDERKKPYAVNEDVSPDARRIPFANMIYVGDGLTDVPCFSLLKNMGQGEQPTQQDETEQLANEQAKRMQDKTKLRDRAVAAFNEVKSQIDAKEALGEVSPEQAKQLLGGAKADLQKELTKIDGLS